MSKFIDNLKKKLERRAFFRSTEKIRLLKAKIELQKEFIAEYESRLKSKTAKRITEYADKLEDGAAAAAVLENYAAFKKGKAAEFTAARESKDSLAARAYREKGKRAGTLTEDGLKAFTDALAAERGKLTAEYAAKLDAEYEALKATYKGKPLGQLREENAVMAAEFAPRAERAAAEKLSGAKAKTEKRIAGFSAKIGIYEKKTAARAAEFKTETALPEDIVLKAENLCMYFGGVKAVDGLTFEVRRGEIFGLIGPNGAGKTTVFNCITQFYKPVKGEIFYRGGSGETVRLNDYRVHDVSSLGIVRTFQNIEVIREITVLENLLVAAHRMYTTGIFSHVLHTPLFKSEEVAMRARAARVLEFLELTPYANMPAYGLPYGVLKKIEIARTLMTGNPRLIILDEPAAGLNDTETAALAALIKRIVKEYDCTVLLVEHDMGLVMDICDRILAISFGKRLAYGTPSEIQADKDVQAAYLGTAEEA